jgi:hypothetical protein
MNHLNFLIEVTSVTNIRSIAFMRTVLLIFSMFLSNAIGFAADISPATLLHFKRQPSDGLTFEQTLQKYGLQRGQVEQEASGVVNRVQYRFTSGSDGIKVERQPVLDQDPQKETLPKPKPVMGAAWIGESIPARPGEKALAWGDFDGDGSDELLIGWPLRILKRDAQAKWVDVNLQLRLNRAERLIVADLDRDGLADIVALDGQHTKVFLNDSFRPWVRHVIDSGFKNQTALAAGFGGTVKMDVISGDIENDRKVFLFRAPAWKPTLLISGIRVIQSVALDVNGDGKIDFVGAQYHPGLVFWLENPGDPSLPWKYHVIDDFKAGGIDGVHGLALTDMDGDGRLDLVAASGWPTGNFPDSIVWFRVPRDTSKPGPWERFVIADRDAPGFNHYPSVGDVNGDGRTDVLSAAKSGPDGNWFAWWEHPSGNLTQPWKKHLIAANQPGATNILVADLNRDGRPDILGGRGHGKGLVWFEAPDWTSHEIDTALVGTHALAVGDLDRDGVVDVVTCAKDSGILAWFKNDGAGHFTEHRIYEDQSAYEIRLVDMNGDGALDILVAGQESGNVVWYENRLNAREVKAHRQSGK